MSALFKELKSEWAKRAPNLIRCGQLLDLIKLEMIRISFTRPQESSEEEIKEQMVMSREMLEIAVEHSVATKDYVSYERYMTQLKTFYYDYSKLIEPSPNMHKILGLNLLYMLVKNRIADFHIELERFPSSLLNKNQYIQPILDLENYYMEGRYNKILQAKNNMPADIYGNFLDMLLDTVRKEIASCIEKSYDRMTPKDTALRLGLKPGSPEINAVAKERNWKVGPDGKYDFEALRSDGVEEVPAVEIAAQTLDYALELEKIV